MLFNLLILIHQNYLVYISEISKYFIVFYSLYKITIIINIFIIINRKMYHNLSNINNEFTILGTTQRLLVSSESYIGNFSDK